MEPEITRADVRNYLRQYRSARRLQEDLRLRAASLRLCLRPAQHGEGPPTAAFRLEQAEQSVRDQQERVAAAICNILAIIDYLPSGSQERSIIELRYIDGLGWGAIERHTYLSKSRASWYEAQGVDRLLTYPRVRQIIAEYKQECKQEQ